GFKWTLQPSQRTKGHVGSTVHIKWHYECNDFGSSRIYYNTRHLFSRNANKQNYSARKNVVSHFSVIGGSNVTIIIPDVDRDKSGSYCCDVDCDYISDVNCTFLVIYALPRINYLTSHLSGNQGDSITLRCNASGYPAPRVTWTHMDTNRTIANSSVTSFNITGNGSGGKYCCHVSNGFGNETNCTSIQVTEPPIITTKWDTLINMKNKSVRINCKATGIPRPIITWHNATNNNVIYEANETLQVKNEECINKTLEYYCRASNIVGNITSNITTVKVWTFCKKENSADNDDDGSILPPENLLQIIIAHSSKTWGQMNGPKSVPMENQLMQYEGETYFTHLQAMLIMPPWKRLGTNRLSLLKQYNNQHVTRHPVPRK
ncbi:neurotrimin-like, partial [Actinia tenebrosa]|uniref:Neurotrimin-like n=1 Tax=Actinia tenebrosa TaxID=6105 RepID=A0A6P8HDQ2_ACTTE